MPEFELIKRYFTRPTPGAELGVGDDAALVRIAPGMELAISTDMLVSGTHFFADTDPFLLGHKTLAVNLSDLAAMGATPRWALLSLSLPEEDHEWLKKFSEGFFALARHHGVELIGGDTTRGPLNFCVTIMGEVPQGAALCRSGARPGDDIWVSGQLGDAALSLAQIKARIQLPAADFARCALALHQPQPRVALGLALRELANSAIDISDGLLADLGHILECSRAGADIDFDAVPAAPLLRRLLTTQRSTESDLALHCMLSGGDDYELCFTAPAENRAKIQEVSGQLDLSLSRIGVITTGSGCTVHGTDGSTINVKEMGYDHFA
jgi:thiamine-monophosphate kinase